MKEMEVEKTIHLDAEGKMDVLFFSSNRPHVLPELSRSVLELSKSLRC